MHNYCAADRLSPTLAYAASVGDIAVISAIVIALGSVGSGIFNFYFPALLVISVAFPTVVAFTFAGSAMAVYGLIFMSGDSSALDGDPTTVILTRLVMLAAVVACGNLYWRIERRRRREAAEAQDELMMQISEKDGASGGAMETVERIKERS